VSHLERVHVREDKWKEIKGLVKDDHQDVLAIEYKLSTLTNT